MNKNIDATIIGNVLMADGIGKHACGFLDALKDNLNVNIKQLPGGNFKDVKPELMKIILKPFSGYGKVACWVYIMGLGEGTFEKQFQEIDSPIKIAYSMFESTKLPKTWVESLNKYFDMVVVPDEALVEIYKNSGVIKPIFVLPLGIWIDRLLDHPWRNDMGDLFTFGMSAAFWERKNHIKLLNAFLKCKFYGNPYYRLVLHGRFGSYKYKVSEAIKEINSSLIDFIDTPLSSSEYDLMLERIRCHVYISRGEGYGIPGRETLALGRPCILSNHTVHKTIVDSGFVIPVPAEQRVKATYELFPGQDLGYFHDVLESDLIKAMEDVVDNYSEHLQRAHKGREWVKQYTWDSLRPRYVNMFKPKKLIFGNSNLLTEDTLQTNSKELYNKYLKEVMA